MLIKSDPDIIKAYFEDSSNLKGGYAEKVILPDTLADLSDVIKDAYSKKIPVTISGGGTATTGARIPFGGIAVSLEKFNKIIDISKKDRGAVVQAGVPVEDFKKACEKEGLFYASHPTEKTAFMGGTVATNASGSRSFKYGPTRKHVRRLKMILPTGHVLDIKRGERTISRANSAVELDNGITVNIPLPSYVMPDVKNAAGYFARQGMDLVDLFIGQEGTLSVIAQMEIALVEKPANIFSCFVFFKKDMDAWNFSDEVRRLSKDKAGGMRPAFNILSIEYFDSNALRLLKDKNANVPKSARDAIFFEEETTEEGGDLVVDKWLGLISKHNGSLDDTWVAMNEKEADDFTGFRYAIPEAVNDIIKRSGFQKLSTDIAVPDEKLFEMMNFYTDAFKKENMEHVIFGHIGECHVHVNILPKSEDELNRAKSLIYSFVKKGVGLGGTVSAEHGIGKIKHSLLEEMYGKTGAMEMAKIKKSLDPNCILGLDNIFPKELLKSI